MGAPAQIVIVGAGPGGASAAHQLRARAGRQVAITLIERGGTAEYLGGTIDTALGRAPAGHWRRRVQLDGVRTRAGTVSALDGRSVTVDGERLAADAVIAAPGLTLDQAAIPAALNVFGFWSPSGAAAATGAVQGLERGTVAVVVSGLPYRCPPAPYGLAMSLQHFYRTQGRPVQVVLTTPEEVPLAAVGPNVSDFLHKVTPAAGVDLRLGFAPDLASLAGGTLRSAAGDAVRFDLALVVPPHRTSPLLAELPRAQGPLVAVEPSFATAAPGLYAIGDAAGAPFPRAADAAAAGGRTAADAVLAQLGLADPAEPHRPAPSCLVGHGGDDYSLIQIQFPDGLPPAGAPQVTVEPTAPRRDLFETAFTNWQALVHEG